MSEMNSLPPKSPRLVVKKVGEIHSLELLQASLRQISGHSRLLFCPHEPLPPARMRGCYCCPEIRSWGPGALAFAWSCSRDVPGGLCSHWLRASRNLGPRSRISAGPPYPAPSRPRGPLPPGSRLTWHPRRGRRAPRVAVGARLRPGGGTVGAEARAPPPPLPPLGAHAAGAPRSRPAGRGQRPPSPTFMASRVTAVSSPGDRWTSCLFCAKLPKGSIRRGANTAWQEGLLHQGSCGPGSCRLGPELSPACPQFTAFHLVWGGSNLNSGSLN